MNSNASEQVSTESFHMKNTTSGGLFKATAGAVVVAVGILTFVWLPAEHGIDPTGVGHLLGLTGMGHIKESLHAEADTDAALTKVTQIVGPDINSSEIALKLDSIQAQLTAIAAAVGVQTATADKVAVEPADVSQEDVIVNAWRDEIDYTLESGEGIEVKLVMEKGAVAEFFWSANGAVLNHDTHGDGSGQSISYEKGRSVPSQAGQLTAAFTGNHGWFWRNRTNDPVVVTLRTRGAYTGLVLP